MRKLFIESRGFSQWLARHLDDESYAELQRRIMDCPESGDVMAGCGGLRKMRVKDPRRQKGRRGGARIIYLHVPEANWVFLLDAFDKDEKEDLNAAERKELKHLAEEFKREAVAAGRKMSRRRS